MIRRIKDGVLSFLRVDVAGDRDRWVKNVLLMLPRGLRILDAGAGEAPYKRWCEGQVYVSQDFSQYDGIGDGVGLQTGSWDLTRINIVSDIVSIPEPDGSFDVILCTEVLEHVPDPVGAITEFTRLLKPGGTLIVTAPFYSITHFAPYYFLTGFSRYFYEEYLTRRNRYEIFEMSPSGSFFRVVAQQLLLIPSFCGRYVGRFLAAVSWAFVLPALGIVSVIIRYDSGSSEMLCFEYFVRAKKL